jgi:hypothetical protein
MAQSYLIFDFGGNEDAAQQARHRVDGWKQAFRLGRKLELRFERPAANEGSGEKKAAHVKLIVRLDFSDHEKLSHTRWLERLPNENPFKGLPVEIVRPKDAAYGKTAALFDSLADQAPSTAKH